MVRISRKASVLFDQMEAYHQIHIPWWMGYKNIIFILKGTCNKKSLAGFFMDNMWHRVIEAKYLTKMGVESWIRLDKEPIKDGSNIWCGITNAFNILS